MTQSDLPRTVLLVVCICGLVKGVVGLARPSFFKAVGAWQARTARGLAVPAAIGLLLLAAALWVVVLLDQTLVNWLVVAFGALFAAAADFYLHPERLEKLLGALVLQRNAVFIRAISALIVLVSLLLIWAALRS